MPIIISLLLPEMPTLPAQLASDPKAWILPSDLQNVPDRVEEQLVPVRLTVSAKGRVMACEPERRAGQDSGMGDLGALYCRLLKRRARFGPLHENKPWSVWGVVMLQNRPVAEPSVQPGIRPERSPSVADIRPSSTAARAFTAPRVIQSWRHGPFPINPAKWATDQDYPLEARQAKLQGFVRFMISVGADGMPESCTITRSSNTSVLDDATCRLMMKRARFKPAEDGTGTAIPATFSTVVRWILPYDYHEPEIAPAGPAQAKNGP